MCGIAGIFDLKQQREIDNNLLTKMRDSLYHRGPDEAGSFTLPGVGLAHRRLSIIDLSSGQQPLSNADQSVTIVFNGEIFNFQDIRAELIEKGHEFKTHSDTETILYAWIEWGEKCIDKLRGMFAFVIWDANLETLFCVRDRLGVKPLLYSITDDGYFLFGSEHKAILQHPNVSTDINPKSVETYFALGYITDPDSIYKNIHKLPAGHTLTIKRGQQPDIKQYWDLPFTPTQLDDKQAQQQLFEKLKEATDIRMLAEVPLGAFLSGGVDSSAIVAIMSQLQDDPVKTCSIGFNDPEFNESEFAQEVADHCKTDHFQQTVDSDDYGLIDTLIDVYDEPYADSSALPTYRVCELAKTQVTVALSGDGADELMSGYRHHLMHLREEKIRSLLPLWVRKLVFGTLGYLYPKADWAPKFLRAKSTFQGLAKDSVEAYFSTVSQNNDQIRDQLFTSNFKQSLDGFNAVDVMKQHAKNAPNKEAQSLIQYLDAKTYMISDIMTKVDRASMAHSLEVRSPFLDHKWIEWISGIDSKYKYDGKTGKSLLKQTMEKYLPDGILYRKKMGFSVPLASWFRGPLKSRVHETLTGDRLKSTGWFNMDFLSKVEQEHQSKIKDHSTLIWSLVMFDAFLKKTQAS
jgi:asparagine synthase (glutamine-hydrolysing)